MYTNAQIINRSTIPSLYTFNSQPPPNPQNQQRQCFEGMKAYKDIEGRLRLFRPELNMERLNNSLARLYMPVRVL